MIQTQIIKIQTPNKLLLNGAWLGPAKAKTVLIFLHGMDSSMFSRMDLAERLVTSETAVLMFNNRGSGVITGFKQLDTSAKGYQTKTWGTAHEVFTDCIDDIEGAINLAAGQGAKQIILVGHSTGCQKSVYYLAKRTQPLIKGAILLAPMSDYADMFKATPPKDYRKQVALAQKMVAEGRAHELLPVNLWPIPVDAQRFLSLFTAESIEEIFSYASGKKPTLLQKVKVPLLVVLAEKDEYRERPMMEIADWFNEVLFNQPSQVQIVPKAMHSFLKSTDLLVRLIKPWLKSI